MSTTHGRFNASNAERSAVGPYNLPDSQLRKITRKNELFACLRQLQAGCARCFNRVGEHSAVGDIAAITDQKTSQVLPQLGSVALQSGEHVGETIAHRVAGKQTKPFKYRDKGTMATIGRGSAVVQMLGGRTMKGKAAQVAWGTVHLALLPTNQDRAKAVVDWAGAGLTHQRGARITVES